MVLTGMPTFHWRTWGLACRTTACASHKRPWLMQKCYNTGLKKPNPQCWASCNQLAECVCELQESMEPFTTFTDAKVFGKVEPSYCMWVTPSKSSELAEFTPPSSWNHRAWVRSTGPMRGMEHLNPVATTAKEGSTATSSPTPPEGARTQPPTPPLGFGDITDILWRGQLLQTLPRQREEQTPTVMVGPTLVVSRMIQDAWGTMSIEMMTSQLNVMGLEPAQHSSTISISKIPILEDAPKLEDW